MSSFRILIPAARKAAQTRTAGYIEALLAAGAVKGNTLEIEAEAWNKVQAQFPDGKEHPLPSLLTRGGHLSMAIARAGARIATGRPVRVPTAVEADRAGKCHTCDKFRASDQRCGLCGCCTGRPLLDKLKWAGEACPDNPPKWGTWNQPTKS